MSNPEEERFKARIKGRKIEVKEISIINPDVQTFRGLTVQMKAKVLPPNASIKTVIWHSDNPDVATINRETGLLEARNLGVATIQAKCAHKSASATVKVSKFLFRFALNGNVGGKGFEDITDNGVIRPFQEDARLLDADKCFEVQPFQYDGSSKRKMHISPAQLSVHISNPEVLEVKKVRTSDGNNGYETSLKFCCLKDGNTEVLLRAFEPVEGIELINQTLFKVEIKGMTGIIMDKRVLRLYKGITERISAKTIPENSDRIAGWSFSNPSTVIASPDGMMNGMVTGLKPGDATVTAFTRNTSLKAYVTVCDISFSLLSPDYRYVHMPNRIKPLDGSYCIKNDSITLYPFINFQGLAHPIDFPESYIVFEIEKPELLDITFTSFRHSNSIFDGEGPALKVRWHGKGSSDVTIMIKKPAPGRGVIIHQETVTFVIE